MYTRPLRTKRLLRLLRKPFILRHNMLDFILIDQDALLASKVLEAAQPVTTAAEVIQITGLNLALEFFIARETAI